MTQTKTEARYIEQERPKPSSKQIHTIPLSKRKGGRVLGKELPATQKTARAPDARLATRTQTNGSDDGCCGCFPPWSSRTVTVVDGNNSNNKGTKSCWQRFKETFCCCFRS